jgi:lipopolysaccharide transport system permease protein
MSSEGGKLINSKDLKFVKKLFFRNWIIILGLPIVFFVLGYLYSYRLVDVYAAKTQILLNTSETYDYQNSISSGLGYYSMYADLTNQQRVLSSRDVLGKVIDKLDLQTSYFIEGRVKTTEQFDNVPFQVEMKIINAQLYQIPIYFKFLSANEFELNYEKGGSSVSLVGNFGKEIKQTDGDFIIKIEKKRTLSDELLNDLIEVNYYFTSFTRNQLINKYKAAIVVENIENTTILEVTLNDVLIKRALMFLDTLNGVYEDYTIESEYSINEKTIFYIDKQLDTISLELNELENEIDEYKKNKEILNLSKEEALYFEQYTQFESDIRMESIKIKSLQDLEEYILNLKKNEKMLPAAYYMLKEDDFLKKLIDELYNKQIRLISILSAVTEKNSRVEQLESSMIRLKADILELISNDKLALESRKTKLEGERDFYKDKIKDLPESQRDLLSIERERIVNEKMYNFLLEKKINTEITKLSIVPKFKVIEHPQSAGIVAPNKNQIKLMFVLAGIFVAFLVAFIRVQFFSKIENPMDLKDVTEMSILGSISLLVGHEKSDIVIDSALKSSISESFRGIRTNIEFMGNENKVKDGSKTLLITSLHPGEGKTFCSTNTSTFLERAHKKVIIIDFDMHKPKVHQRFNMTNEDGLSQYLSGKIEKEQLIKKIKGFDNLHIINAGPVPPSPSELVHSYIVENLIAELEKTFDYIIIDTPPIGLISDARVLMKYSDLNIFATSAKICTKRGIEFLETISREAEVKECTLLMNKEEIEIEHWSTVIKPKTSIWDVNFKEIWDYRDLLLLFVKRDIVTVYKQTILGPVWFFVQPLMTMLVYIFVFGNIAKISTDGLPQAAFYLAGIIIWNYFAECFNQTSDTFTQNSNIFGKVYFPRIIVPLSKVISALIKFLIQLMLFVIVLIYYLVSDEKVNPSFWVLLMPVLILMMAGIGLGSGLIFSSLTTKYRDLKFLIAFGVQLMMYATPVIYPMSSIGYSNGELLLRKLLFWNPFTHIIEAFKYMYLGRGEFSGIGLVYSAIFMLMVLMIGVLVFNKTEKKFMDTV